MSVYLNLEDERDWLFKNAMPIDYCAMEEFTFFKEREVLPVIFIKSGTKTKSPIITSQEEKLKFMNLLDCREEYFLVEVSKLKNLSIEIRKIISELNYPSVLDKK